MSVVPRLLPAHGSAPGPEILMVIGSLEIGGAEKHLVAVVPVMRGKGMNATVYSLADGPLRRDLASSGVPVTVSPRRIGRGRGFSLRALPALIVAAAHLFGVLLWRRPRIVHFFLPEAYLIGAPLAVLAAVPIRVMSRRSLNEYQRGYPPFVARIERSLHGAMTAILGNSLSVVRQLHEREGVSERRLGLIYNGLNIAAFATGAAREKIRRSMRDSLNLPEAALVLVMVANLIPYKGHADLLAALATIAPRLPDNWRLLLVGHDGGAQAALRAQAQQLAIASNIMFLDSRSDVPNLLAAGDIGILCSHQEGFSNAVLEGMAAGLPMVVTAVGGNPEAVLDGENGYVVPPRNPARLGEAILRLADDPGLRARLGAAARSRVIEEFSLEQCVGRYDEFYRSLLAGGVPADLPPIRAAI
ncbi:MAG: glycosyltransferase [Pseudolabrys sp.]